MTTDVCPSLGIHGATATGKPCISYLYGNWKGKSNGCSLNIKLKHDVKPKPMLSTTTQKRLPESDS